MHGIRVLRIIKLRNVIYFIYFTHTRRAIDNRLFILLSMLIKLLSLLNFYTKKKKLIYNNYATTG